MLPASSFNWRRKLAERELARVTTNDVRPDDAGTLDNVGIASKFVARDHSVSPPLVERVRGAIARWCCRTGTASLTVVEEFVKMLAIDNADATQTTMLAASRPPRIINCFPGPSLLAGLVVNRFAEHLLRAPTLRVGARGWKKSSDAALSFTHISVLTDAAVSKGAPFGNHLARIIHAFVGMSFGNCVSSFEDGSGVGLVVKVEDPLSQGQRILSANGSKEL